MGRSNLQGLRTRVLVLLANQLRIAADLTVAGHHAAIAILSDGTQNRDHRAGFSSLDLSPPCRASAATQSAAISIVPQHTVLRDNCLQCGFYRIVPATVGLASRKGPLT